MPTFSISNMGAVASLQEFVQGLNNYRSTIDNDKLWYRGHSKKEYKLLPTIGRPFEYAGYSKTFTPHDENRLLHRFRRRAFPILNRMIPAGEALFLARHHSLPTRLLDWSANPLYALYFACIDHNVADAAVWCFRRIRNTEGIDAFELGHAQNEDHLLSRYPGDSNLPEFGLPTNSAIKVVDPFYNDARILAQDGAFTFHANPWTPMEDFAGAEFDYRLLDIAELCLWTVPARSKGPIIRELSGLGVTHRTVFPDLDGIAKSIWETEVLWRGEKVE